MKKKLQYICVQPRLIYYAWQVEVMINNFIKNGIEPDKINIICSTQNNIIVDSWKKLVEGYEKVKFFFYEDTRENSKYISSIRPHILAKHFTKHTELQNDVIFYHDCDMIFTKPVSWDKFLDDDVWYASDAISYIGARYIKEKEYGIYEKMCDIIGIDKSIPEMNEFDSGGAQYIMKNVDATFWEKVYYDSEKLYEFFLEHLEQYPETDSYHPIQKWTADMWALLWNAWYFKHQVKVVPEMAFAWPTQDASDWYKHLIFHNAGVSSEQTGMFCKVNYIKRLPYDITLDYDTNRCSIHYAKEILDTAKVSKLVDPVKVYLKDKKVAVGLFGIHYQEQLQHWMGWITQVNYKRVFANNKRQLLDSFIPSFYSETYFSEKQEELVQDFKFKQIRFREVNNTKAADMETVFYTRNTIFTDTIKLILEDSEKYDYVLLMRYDLRFRTFPLEYVKFDKINLMCKTKWGDDENLVDDNFYFMPYSKLKMFYETITKIPLTISSHNYHKHFNSEDVSYLVEGKFYSHEIPTYFIQRT